MSWVDTGWGVAPMAYAEVAWDGADRERVGDAVRQSRALTSAEAELSVPFVVQRCRPEPARAGFVDLGPETLDDLGALVARPSVEGKKARMLPKGQPSRRVAVVGSRGWRAATALAEMFSAIDIRVACIGPCGVPARDRAVLRRLGAGSIGQNKERPLALLACEFDAHSPMVSQVCNYVR